MDVDQRKYLLIHAFSFPHFGCFNSLLAESKSCPISYEWLTLRFGVRRPADLVSRRCMNPSRSTTHRDTAWRLGRICGNGFAASWSCFLSLNLCFVKGRRRPCVGLETWIFRNNSGGLLEIIWACAKLGPDIPMKIIMKQWPAPVVKRPMA